MECFPQSLTVHRIEGSLDIYVSHMQRFSKFTMQLSQETQRQNGVYVERLRVKPDCCGLR